MSVAVEFIAEGPDEWRGVWVRFAARRSRIVGAVLQRPGAEDLAVALTSAVRWLAEPLRVELDATPVDAGDRWVLLVTFAGEPVHALESGAVSTAQEIADDSIRVGGALELFEERRALIDRAGPDGRDQAFFYELDVLSHPAMLQHLRSLVPGEVEPRSAAVVELVDALRARVLARARHAYDASRFPLPGIGEGVEGRAADIAGFAALQAQLVHLYYGGADGQVDWAGVARAFERFATGRLRVVGPGPDDQVYNSEPDSAYFFTFSEFALVALELGIDPPFWERMLPAFVTAVPMYMHVYWPAGAHVRRGCFFAEWRTLTWAAAGNAELAHVPEAMFHRWRPAHAGLTTRRLADRLGEHALKAFRAEVVYEASREPVT